MSLYCTNKQSIIPFTLSGNEKEIMKVDNDGKVWAEGQQIAIYILTDFYHTQKTILLPLERQMVQFTMLKKGLL